MTEILKPQESLDLQEQNEPDEGVVKYQCHHQTQAIDFSQLQPTSRTQPLQDEDSLDLNTLLTIRRQLFDKQWIGVTSEGIGFGNLSTKVSYIPPETPKRLQFLISATQTGHIQDLSKNELSLVHNFSLRDNFVKSSGPLPPSSEAITHGIIYQADPTTRCIIHIHNSEYWTKGLQHLPVVESPYGSIQLAQELQQKLHTDFFKQHGVFVMRNHHDGIFSWGPSFETSMKQLVQFQ